MWVAVNRMCSKIKVYGANAINNKKKKRNEKKKCRIQSAFYILDFTSGMDEVKDVCHISVWVYSIGYFIKFWKHAVVSMVNWNVLARGIINVNVGQMFWQNNLCIFFCFIILFFNINIKYGLKCKAVGNLSSLEIDDRSC